MSCICIAVYVDFLYFNYGILIDFYPILSKIDFYPILNKIDFYCIFRISMSFNKHLLRFRFYFSACKLNFFDMLSAAVKEHCLFKLFICF